MTTNEKLIFFKASAVLVQVMDEEREKVYIRHLFKAGNELK